MRKWVFPRQFSNGAQTSCTHTGRIKSEGDGKAKNIYSVREMVGGCVCVSGDGKRWLRVKGKSKKKPNSSGPDERSLRRLYILIYIYVYTRRMRANITSPLHISNLISHMHNRKFPVARTRAHRPSSSLRGGISFQFLSHRTTVELFLTPLPLPLELILSTTV